MMFTRNVFLGSVGFVFGLFGVNVAGAIAQSNDEFQPPSSSNTSYSVPEKLEPSPVFLPILQDIKIKIPRNLGFRLPTYFPTLAQSVKPIFSVSDKGIATVNLEFMDSRCRGLPKSSRGYLVGCRALSISSGSIASDFWRQRVVEPEGEVFNLSENVPAKHIQGDGWGMIAWANHGTFFSVYGPDRLYLGDGCNTARGSFCDFRTGELVKIARSIAIQPRTQNTTN